MTVNLQSADKALKSYYLDAITEQLDNRISPFYSMIKKTTNDVWGKDVKKLVSYGINGGIGAGTEDGSLPLATGNNYAQLTSTLKNLYGTIEISDKAIRASENNSGAFVNLLTAEMEGLVRASSFNFERMLFGDGSGELAKVQSVNSAGYILVQSVKNLAEGMIVDFRSGEDGSLIEGATSRVITSVDRNYNRFYISGPALDSNTVVSGTIICLQGSYNNEITGLKAIFNANGTSLYGVSKETNAWMNPVFQYDVSYSANSLQILIDEIEERSGSTPNLIITTLGIRRDIVGAYERNNRFFDTLDINGYYKGLSYNGIPIVTSRLCPKGTIFVLNTDYFELHQLCDWQWLSDDDGRVLKQVPGKPVYTATLVKYAELMCTRPTAQGMLTLSMTEY